MGGDLGIQGIRLVVFLTHVLSSWAEAAIPWPTSLLTVKKNWVNVYIHVAPDSYASPHLPFHAGRHYESMYLPRRVS